MEQHKMILITKQRIYLHPDFRARLVANWRSNTPQPIKKVEIAELAMLLEDKESFTIDDAVSVAEQLLKAEALQRQVSAFSKSFWNEYRTEVLAMKSIKKKRGKSSPPPPPTDTPSP